MTKGKVLIAAPVHDILTDGLKENGYEIINPESVTPELAEELIKDCVGIITSTRLQLDENFLQKATDLKWIGRMGSGMEVIDTEFAAKRNIHCYSSPEGNANAVAEHALGMLLSLTKKIAASAQEVQNGKWLREENRGIELEGKTIGIIGFGHTGSAFAKKLSGFDMQVMIYDKDAQKQIPAPLIKCNSLEPIFQQADIISFHVPLTDDTYHYFDRDFLERMQKSFIIINTSRGKVTSLQCIYEGLISQKLVAAALDVLEMEPPDQLNGAIKKNFSEMLKMPEVLITPHIAGYSKESLFKMSDVLLKKIVTNE